MKFTTLHNIADLVGARRYTAAARLIDKTLETETGTAWQTHLGRLSVFLRSSDYTPFASILAKGNGKLPFLSFSALPGTTCPGAGDCLDWCYSFKGWRYPAVFARQVQNTVLLWENQQAIRDAFVAPSDGRQVDFRLYVDGDFDSLETVYFWWNLLITKSYLKAYGYSKSLSLLLQADMAPDNYKLNISSGHNADASTVAAVAALPYARGYFVAVDIGRKVASADHGKRSHQRELRQAYGRKAFTCPGQCGTCTPGGHACGSDRFKDLDIIIAAH